MTELNDPVHNEPVAGKSGETMKENSMEEKSSANGNSPDPAGKKEKALKKDQVLIAEKKGKKDSIDHPQDKPASSTVKKTKTGKVKAATKPAEAPEPLVEKISEPEAGLSDPAEETPEKEVPEKEVPEKEAPEKVVPDNVVPDNVVPEKEVPEKEAPEKDAPEKDASDKSVTGEVEAAAIVPEEPDSFEVDYSALTREELVNRLETLMDNQPVQSIRADVDHIKINFYKKYKQEVEQLRKKFVEEGGAIEDFSPPVDSLESSIKVLFAKYRDKKAEYNHTQDVEKQSNLVKKYEVIEKIKDLINRKESINRTFHEFRELQKEWHHLGLVPQANLKDLWDTYNHHVEKFYDYIKINQELKDLDLKKNLEAKITLCEKAEKLLVDSSVINAFKTLQKYHEQWREIGPISSELREEIWERFREATSKINKKHQAHFEDLKKSQKNNLEQKALLCEKAEEISTLSLDTHRDWDAQSKELMELQKVWRTIGFAPRKENNQIYDRFRIACDEFYNRKRDFYSQNKELQTNNLQLKTDLCIQAESLKESSEWKKTTEDLIILQNKWKEIGPVPKKQSDLVWKRFRAACDHFFEKKSNYFKNIDQTYADNLKLKEQLIEEIENLQLSDNVKDNFDILNESQRKWAEIGFVPFKHKEKLQERYRKAINKKFDQLEIDDTKRNLMKFKNRLGDIVQKPKSDVKLRQERDKYINRLQQLKNDIVLWENNIGFFAKTKNAQSMIDEVNNRIKNARESIILLERKIDMIDKIDDEKHN